MTTCNLQLITYNFLGLSAVKQLSTAVPAIRCYSATRATHKIFSRVFASIRQPLNFINLLSKDSVRADTNQGVSVN